MLKRSKTDEEIDLEEAGTDTGAVLVVNVDPDACELIARLIESAGWPATRSYNVEAIPQQIQKGSLTSVVIDSMQFGITTAFEILNEIRSSGPDVRDTPVVILAATATNRLFAYQSGADGFVVRPVHADEFLDVMLMVLTRSPDERVDYRRSQLLGGANTG